MERMVSFRDTETKRKKPYYMVIPSERVLRAERAFVIFGGGITGERPPKEITSERFTVCC